jgi:hypothetical protein
MGRADTSHVRVLRTIGCVALVAVALFYLQFGVSAIGQWPPQAALVFLGVAALGVGAWRTLNGRAAARIVCLGTAPLWIMQILATAVVDDESPAFIVGTGVVPLIAAIVWLTHRRPRVAASPGADPSA